MFEPFLAMLFFVNKFLEKFNEVSDFVNLLRIIGACEASRNEVLYVEV